MKNLLLSALFLASAATASHAQTADEYTPADRTSRLRFGVFVAPTRAWMKPAASTDDRGEFNVQNRGAVTGFMWGLMVDYNFAENYAIATGLQYNSAGGQILATAVNTATLAPNTVQRADFTYRVAYVELPFQLKLRTDELTNRLRVFGQLGLTGGINIGKTADYTVNYTNNSGAASVATVSDRKIQGGIGDIAPVMLQLNIGGGTEIGLTDKLAVYLGLFFNNGFAPDATNPQDFDSDVLGYSGSFRDANTRLNNLALKVGLFF